MKTRTKIINTRKRALLGSARFLLVGVVMMGGLVSCGGDAVEEYVEEHVEKYVVGGGDLLWLREGMRIEIGEAEWEQLEMKRKEILDSNYHFKYARDYVKVKLDLGGRKVKAKMRFKGGEVDHYQGDQWSFKIKSKDSLLLGYTKLGIQGPHTKNNLLEYLFHQVCKKEGIIALPYHFLPIQFNEQAVKTYALEPVIGQATLSHNGRKEGAIIKMKKDAYWRLMVAGEWNIDSTSMLSAQIVPVEKKWDKRSERNARQTKHARNLLDRFRNRGIAPKEVFDYELFAKYVAISELFGSSHNLRWLNLRLYLNPDTRKLEPIAFDCFDGDDPRNEIIWFLQDKRFEYLLHPLLDEPEFKALAVEHLGRMTDEDYMKSIFSDEHQALNYYQELIKENQADYLLKRDHMLQRAKSIRQQLNYD